MGGIGNTRRLGRFLAAWLRGEFDGFWIGWEDLETRKRDSLGS